MKNWHKLVLKFLAEENDRFGRERGEQLWKERFSDQKVEEIKEIMGAYYLSAMYQQVPPDEENAPFKSEYFKYYKDDLDYIIIQDKKYLKNKLNNYIVVDPAFTTGNNSDYTAMMHFYISPDKNYFIDEVIQKKYSINTLIEVIYAFYNKHKPFLLGIESVAAQDFIASQLLKRNLNIKRLMPNGKSKETRAIPASAKMEAGQIYFKRDHWNNEFEKELINFPNGNDDQVDCLSYAVTFEESNFKMPMSKRRDDNNLF